MLKGYKGGGVWGAAFEDLGCRLHFLTTLAALLIFFERTRLIKPRYEDCVLWQIVARPRAKAE